MISRMACIQLIQLMDTAIRFISYTRKPLSALSLTAPICNNRVLDVLVCKNGRKWAVAVVIDVHQRTLTRVMEQAKNSLYINRIIMNL